MSYIDDMKAMIGRGVGVADRKSQELRLQAELSRVSADLASARTALGKVVYSHPTLASQIQRECPGEYLAISSLLQEEQDIRSKIESLQRQAFVPNVSPRQAEPLHCTQCNAAVTLDLAYCPHCGDNLFELKRQYRLCPQCGTYHTSDSMFCIQCGSKTIELPVAPIIQLSSEEENAHDESASLTERPNQNETETDSTLEVLDVTWVDKASIGNAVSTCPKCGTSVTSGDMFCGECGTRLVD